MLRFLALFVAVGTLIAGCTSGGGGDASPAVTAEWVDAARYAARGDLGVGATTLEFVDRTRPTAPNGEYAGSPERRLSVEIWYPAILRGDAPEVRDVPVEGGPYPLIIFAHGLGSFRRQSAQYAQHLASHGYVVASPDFPSSNLASPGGARMSAVLEQPADVSFIIDEIQRLNVEPGSRFRHALNGDVGVTGHSLGGLTSLLLAYGPLRDDRISAVLPISAPACFLDDKVVGDVSVPIMHVGGSEDLIVDPASIRRGYDVSNAPRYFALIRGADHVGFIDFDLEDTALVASLRAGLLEGDRLRSEAEAIERRIGGDPTACIIGESIGGFAPIENRRQRELLRLIGALFFEAYLRDDGAALELLRGGDLSEVAPEVAFEFE